MFTSAPVVTTPRLTLRGISAADFPAIEAFYASDRAQYVGGQLDTDKAFRHVAYEIGQWTLRGYGRWAVEVTETGDFCGIVGITHSPLFPEPELGWAAFCHRIDEDAFAFIGLRCSVVG